MTKAEIFSAGFSLAGVLVLKFGNPLARLQRGITMLRATGFLAQEIIDGAMARRDRWKECVERAKLN
jgi:hypothetical protein